MTTMRSDQRKDDWLKNQFKIYKKHEPISLYRDVLLITSFIEAVIIKKALSEASKNIKFKKALKILGLDIDKNNEMKSKYNAYCQYKDSLLIEINIIRVQRNKLLHTILDKSKQQKDIEDIIKDMAKEIKRVCCNSILFRDYFKTNHNFDPAAMIQNSNQPEK